MKKYRVLKEFPLCKVGEEFIKAQNGCIHTNSVTYSDTVIPKLISEGWLAEVPEEKELWEKLYERTQLLIAEDKKECQEVAKIARQHFADVARKATEKWDTDFRTELSLHKYLIQAIEKDGEK